MIYTYFCFLLCARKQWPKLHYVGEICHIYKDVLPTCIKIDRIGRFGWFSVQCKLKLASTRSIGFHVYVFIIFFLFIYFFCAIAIKFQSFPINWVLHRNILPNLGQFEKKSQTRKFSKIEVLSQILSKTCLFRPYWTIFGIKVTNLDNATSER